jgi:hypothetical protein
LIEKKIEIEKQMKREEEKTGKYLAQRGKTEYMADSDGRKEY